MKNTERRDIISDIERIQSLLSESDTFINEQSRNELGLQLYRNTEFQSELGFYFTDSLMQEENYERTSYRKLVLKELADFQNIANTYEEWSTDEIHSFLDELFNPLSPYYRTWVQQYAGPVLSRWMKELEERRDRERAEYQLRRDLSSRTVEEEVRWWNQVDYANISGKIWKSKLDLDDRVDADALAGMAQESEDVFESSTRGLLDNFSVQREKKTKKEEIRRARDAKKKRDQQERREKNERLRSEKEERKKRLRQEQEERKERLRQEQEDKKKRIRQKKEDKKEWVRQEKQRLRSEKEAHKAFMEQAKKQREEEELLTQKLLREERDRIQQEQREKRLAQKEEYQKKRLRIQEEKARKAEEARKEKKSAAENRRAQLRASLEDKSKRADRFMVRISLALSVLPVRDMLIGGLLVLLLAVAAILFHVLEEPWNSSTYDPDLRTANSSEYRDSDVREREQTEKSPILPKYEAMYTYNNDLYGWLNLPSLGINLPVMQCDSDNVYYMEHDFYGNYDPVGTVFTKGKLEQEQNEKPYILYAKANTQEDLFHPLLAYAEENFAGKHQIFGFDTVYETGQYEVISALYRPILQNQEDLFTTLRKGTYTEEEELLEMKEYLMEQGLYYLETELNLGDEFLYLETLDYQQEGGKFVVVARKKM